jgi:acyl-CoA dehydrogenase
LTPYVSPWMDDELAAFRDTAARFVSDEMLPHEARWRQDHRVDRATWRRMGELGLLCLDVPAEYGGGGGDFRHEAVLYEEVNRRGLSGFGQGVHSICAQYLLNHGTTAQKQRWLPKLASGELIGAIAMTEPAAGSDLRGIRTRARREGDHYRINGSKLFITNGAQAGLLILVAKTAGEGRSGAISLLVFETEGLAGYRVGRVLEKMGMDAQDTAELFFEDVEVPAECLLGGEEGHGLHQLMADLPYERLIVALGGVAAMEGGLEATISYTRERRAFGQALYEFQNTRFKLAELATMVRIARVFIDDCIVRRIEGRLDTETAAMAKWWITDTQQRVLDECVQLYGGYGYMTEFMVCRMFADSRVQRIYGGANEIMKELIARGL